MTTITEQIAEFLRIEELKKMRERLIEQQKKRKLCVEKYKDFIEEMVVGKQKGIRFRKWFRGYLINGSNKVFQTELEEYEYIGKFGRGAWDEMRLKKTFNKEELKVIEELATEYGAFDY